MSQPFAVFDIDGTIFRSSLFLEVIYRGTHKKVLPSIINSDIKNAYDKWLKRKSSTAYEEYINCTVESFDRNLAGVNVNKLQIIAKEIVDEYHEHTYVYTRDLLKSLKEQGYFLIAITGSIEEVAIEFTKRYGFDYVRPTYLDKKDGKYSGTYNIADDKKQSELAKIVEQNKLTYKGSYAIGDSSSDIGMLALVENPIAFNPDKILFKEASKEAWKIVIERKNMIYQLEVKNGSYILAETNA
ncbi:MAG: HAD-IB family hydrolase [Candidatus Saccharibacteria bacterium]